MAGELMPSGTRVFRWKSGTVGGVVAGFFSSGLTLMQESARLQKVPGPRVWPTMELKAEIGKPSIDARSPVRLNCRILFHSANPGVEDMAVATPPPSRA